MKASTDAQCAFKDDDYTAAPQLFPRYFQSTHNNPVPIACVIKTWIEIIDEVSQVWGRKNGTYSVCAGWKRTARRRASSSKISQHTGIHDVFNIGIWTSSPTRSRQPRKHKKWLNQPPELFFLESWLVWTGMQFEICLCKILVIFINPDSIQMKFTLLGNRNTIKCTKTVRILRYGVWYFFRVYWPVQIRGG
jgi:hypothetical protein